MPPKGKKVATKPSSTSRSRKKARELSPPPPSLPWEFSSSNQLARYKVLSKRTIIPSRFFDAFTIHNLGLKREVTTFLQNIGWTKFAGFQFRTYREVTYEILSTLHADYNPHDHLDPGCITFRCMGEDRRMSMGAFNNLFGFPSQGISWIVPQFVPNTAWYALTGQTEYNPSKSKASFLRNHALRYIHRVMSMSIFGRGESTGVVSKVELLFLWAMYNNMHVNTGVWFIRHLLHVAKNPTGKICVGGLLSVIADAFGFVPIENVHHVVDGSHIVDIDTLVNMRFCRHIGGGQFRLLDDTGHVLHQDDAEADADEEAPNFEEVDMSGFPNAFPEHQQEAAPSFTQPAFQMAQVMERFERLETRMTRSDELQMQMMNLLQQNMDATARIEDKLSRWK